MISGVAWHTLEAALALAIEPADARVMRRPPRDPEKAILSAAFLRGVAFYAVLIAGVTLAAFYLVGGGDAAVGRTAAFMTLALAEGLHLGNGRSRDAVVAPHRMVANVWAIAAVVAVFGLQALTVALPSLREMLEIVPLVARAWGVVLLLSALPALIGQAIKLPRSRRVVRSPTTR